MKGELKPWEALKALTEWKEVQYYSLTRMGWVNCNHAHSFTQKAMNHGNEYRIKPRAFKEGSHYFAQMKGEEKVCIIFCQDNDEGSFKAPLFSRADYIPAYDKDDFLWIGDEVILPPAMGISK